MQIYLYTLQKKIQMNAINIACSIHSMEKSKSKISRNEIIKENRGKSEAIQQ